MTCATVMVGRSGDNFQSQFSATLNSWDGTQVLKLVGPGSTVGILQACFPLGFL